jgi:biotin carboxylase
MPSVLLVGNYMPSIAAVRSLAAAGYRVVLGDGGEYSPARHSRYRDETWRHPPVERGEEFLAALVTFLSARPDVSVVLPLRGDYVEYLVGDRHRLPSTVVVAAPDREVVRTCMDKAGMFEVARRVGVPYQPMAQAQDLDALAATCEELGYPCIVRPSEESHELLAGRSAALICHDAAELADAFPVWPEGHEALLVQRYAPGPRHDVTFAASRGRIVARIESRVQRTDRMDGTGLRVAAVTVAPDPRLLRYCDALVEHLGYTGVGVAQFIVSSHAGPHFLELNPRFGVGLALMERYGLDLTVAAIELARDPDARRGQPEPRYPVGKRYAWTSRDLYGLGLAWSRGEIDARAANRWLWAALRAAVGADVHATWSLRDPLPTLAIYAHLLSRALGWARRSGVGRAASDGAATQGK